MTKARGGTAVFLQNRDFFGAMVVHVPLLETLRRLTGPLVVYAPFERGRMFTAIGLADEVCVYAGAGGALWSDLRERKFERIVLLRPQSFGLTALISTAGATRTLGYATALSKLVFTRTIRRNTQIYRARNYMDLVAGEAPPVSFAAAIEALAARSSATAEHAFVLMPCGSEERKLWGERNFVELALALKREHSDARFVLVLGGTEARYAELFRDAGLAECTTSLIDKSLADIAVAVRAARAVVANDCGPSHVAQLAGVPTVLVFGNWDGAARTRIAEWFDPRPGARCLTTAEPGSITDLAVTRVLEAVQAVVRDPATPGVTVAVPSRTGTTRRE
ncbi:MAG: hypothetical protein JNL28_14855 [Planctomycetes bacterium]|nr:hypothetical protein [Planctomycetota bacterium]